MLLYILIVVAGPHVYNDVYIVYTISTSADGLSGLGESDAVVVEIVWSVEFSQKRITQSPQRRIESSDTIKCRNANRWNWSLRIFIQIIIITLIINPRIKLMLNKYNYWLNYLYRNDVIFCRQSEWRTANGERDIWTICCCVAADLYFRI